MKYRQKIFLSTLVMFLTALNIGAYLLFNAAYRTSLNSERERSFSEHGFICSALGRDIDAILAREQTADDAVWDSLFERYAAYYKTQGVLISIENADGYTNSNIPVGSKTPEIPDDGSQASLISSISGVPYLLVGGRINGVGFGLKTARSVSGMQAGADNLSHLLTLGSAMMSAALAAALYVMLKRLTNPIKKLSDAASAIAGGDYSIRTEIRGRDEIAELAKRFFEMAGKIEAQIKELKLEAEKKQRFIDDLAHEMRTPLAAIGGYAQYLSDAAVSEEERLSACAYLSRQSTRLADLSDKLMMLTKLRQWSPVIEPVRLRDLFADAKKTVAESEISIRFAAGRHIWRADATLLSMLLVNLINNAIHACKTGCQIIVTADDHKIVLTDNGCGMSSEALAHVTEPFFREDTSRSRTDGGAGLGLSICQSICDCLGYALQIESKEAKGTVVTVLQLHNDIDTNC